MRIAKWLLPTLLMLAAGLYWLYKERGELIAAVAANKMLDELDTNADGVLTEDEGPAGMFSLVDVNRDGIANRDELVTLIARSTRPFRWSNPPDDQASLYPGLRHSTFRSELIGEEVGYNIYLPPNYASPDDANQRYPVIYYLHGGRPGNESLSVDLAEPIHNAIQTGSIRPLIFVWVNGGKVSHYNHADSPGEDVFIRELIPHIDATYRTVASRDGRALQGFSQGGRGTTRLMFKYPELFVSAAPGGGGYAVEKQIQSNAGVEIDTRRADAEALDFGAGNDAYSLAKQYAKKPHEPALKIMIWGGEKGFNYAAVLEYLEYLDTLELNVEQLFVSDVDHNPFLFYEASGRALLEFHDRHWGE